MLQRLKRRLSGQRLRIDIQPQQRVCLFGRTGSGKTTLAKRLLSSSGTPWVVLDPKWDFRAVHEGKPVRTVESFNPKLRAQILRAPMGAGELETYDEQIERIWREGDRIIYVDELTLINPGRTTLRPALGAAIRTGRSRGVGVWCGSQRPKDIPSAVFTESEHFFVFQLQFEADRDKVASFTGDRVADALSRVRQHDFVYYNVLDDTCIYGKQGRVTQ